MPEFLLVPHAAVRVNLLAATSEDGRVLPAETLDLLAVVCEDLPGACRTPNDHLFDSDRGGRPGQLPAERASSSRSLSS